MGIRLQMEGVQKLRLLHTYESWGQGGPQKVVQTACNNQAPVRGPPEDMTLSLQRRA